MKQWEGFDGIRKKEDIVKSKEELPWYEESDSDCWNDTEPQQMGTQSYFDCLLSEDEIFDSDASDDEDEEEIYLSCFMVNNPVCVSNIDSGMTNEVNNDDELLRQEVGDINVSSFATNSALEHVQVNIVHLFELFVTLLYSSY